MEGFTISLAETPIRIIPLCPEIRTFFTDYLCEDTPLFTVATTEQDLEKERVYADRTWKGKEAMVTPWPKRYLETIFLLRTISSRMPEYDTVLFHGSVIAADGRAYLFTAPSGTGKTTHTQLWLKQCPGAYVLNGDKPFLKVLPDGGVMAFGVPWKGKEKLGCNEKLPLEAICLLDRSPENHITAISPKEAIDGLVRQTNMPEDPVGKVKTLQVLDRISKGVRLFRLGCNMEPEAAQVSMKAMIPDRAVAGSDD